MKLWQIEVAAELIGAHPTTVDLTQARIFGERADFLPATRLPVHDEDLFRSFIAEAVRRTPPFSEPGGSEHG